MASSMEIYNPWLHQWKYITHGFINGNIYPIDSSIEISSPWIHPWA
jgi:hypothetical protein